MDHLYEFLFSLILWFYPKATDAAGFFVFKQKPTEQQ